MAGVTRLGRDASSRRDPFFLCGRRRSPSYIEPIESPSSRVADRLGAGPLRVPRPRIGSHDVYPDPLAHPAASRFSACMKRACMSGYSHPIHIASLIAWPVPLYAARAFRIVSHLVNTRSARSRRFLFRITDRKAAHPIGFSAGPATAPAAIRPRRAKGPTLEALPAPDGGRPLHRADEAGSRPGSGGSASLARWDAALRAPSQRAGLTADLPSAKGRREARRRGAHGSRRGSRRGGPDPLRTPEGGAGECPAKGRTRMRKEF